MKNDELTQRYAKKIEPILGLAQKAYGLRGQQTKEHKASERYTELLKEYYDKGGSLVALAETLDVAYSGMRRRIFSSRVAPTKRKQRSTLDQESFKKTVERVLRARDTSTEVYHKEIYKAYHSGTSLAALATEIGLSSSAPLYYAVQRQEIRAKEKR